MNATNENGWTPLHLACMIGLPEVVKLLLLQSSIDVHIKDIKGRTPLMQFLWLLVDLKFSP